MHSTALARALTAQRATRAQQPAAPHTPAATPIGCHPLPAAIGRQARAEARTMLEMARDRDGAMHAWQQAAHRG